MRIQIIKLIYFIIFLFTTTVGFSQQVTVTTIIVPPYSPYLSDYVGYNQKMVVTLKNNTNNMLSVRLEGTITGNNILIKTKPGFKPLSPIVLAPNQFMQLSGTQMSDYLDPQNLNFSGITVAEITNGNGLPEGNYQFCYRALDYNSGSPLSSASPGGCASVNISHFEAPIILSPKCGSSVNELNPQNVIFVWNIPAGVKPNEVEYELQMAEMYPLNVAPQQALDAATDPSFFKKTIKTNTYIYGLSDPKLEFGKKYAFRITAKAVAGKNLNFKNKGASVACSFTYGQLKLEAKPAENKPNKGNKDLPADSKECIAQCEIAEPADKSPITPNIGDTVSIGLFQMKISTLQGNAGTGIIKIPFMKANVKVNFTGLQINKKFQAYGNSKATAAIEENIVESAIAANQAGEIDLIKSKMDQIQSFIDNNQRYVSEFSPAMEPVGVPFALSNKGFDLNILGLIFTPKSAYLNTLFNFEMPEALESELLTFSKKGICIRPNGFGAEPSISLKNDKSVKLTEDISMKFIGGNQNTYLTFNCSGIQKVVVKGAYIFSRNKLLPVTNGKVDANENSKSSATFTAEIVKNGEWLVDATFTPPTFTIPDATDFIFTASNVKIDQSDVANVPGMKFHSTHPKKGNKDWKGLYIGKLGLTLPESFSKKGEKITVEAGQILADKSGLWMKALVTNLLKQEEGSISNWKFSIDTLGFDIQASALSGGFLAGGIQLPIAETSLGYRALIQKGNKESDFLFSVTTKDAITCKMWAATLKLDESSTVVLKKENGEINPEAKLNGSVMVTFNKSPDGGNLDNMNLPELKFQELGLKNIGKGANAKPKLSLSVIELANIGAQAKMNKLPINLTSVGLDNKPDAPGLKIGLKINLIKSVSAFEAGTELVIRAKYEAENKRFALGGIELKKITINSDLGVIKLKGEIEIYKSDPVYGTGFRGDIKATVKAIGVAIQATLQAGKVGSDPDAENNTNYRYFFCDISARWSKGGLPLPGVPAIAFYGFSGGMYFNMERGALTEQTNDKFKDGKDGDMKTGASRSGVSYKPKNGSLGFMAGITLGMAGEATAFNADLKLSIELKQGFGIKKINFDGSGFIMGKIENRPSGLVKVGVSLEMDFEKPMFHCLATIDGGFDKGALAVTVAASLNLHFEPGTWYVKLGSWENDDKPWKDVKRIQVDINADLKLAKASINFNAYFMMGTDIGDIPRSPLKVRQMLGEEGKPDVPKVRDAKIFLGKGFAMGAGFRLTADFEFVIFYANIEAIMGFDMLLAKNTNMTCNGKSDYGIKGWYAKGNAYAYLDVDAGLMLNLWVWKGKFSLMQMTAAAELKAEMPNPSWIAGKFAMKGSVLGGMIEIETSFEMEAGKKCKWGTVDPFDDLPIVSDIIPSDGDDEVSVFECPQAAFNFKMGSNFEIKEPGKKGKVRKFKTELKSFVVTTGGNEITGKGHYNASKNGYTYLADDAFLSKKQYKITIIAEGYEQKDGKWKLIRSEKKSIEFKTGERPDKVDENNVISAYPYIGQRYFLKDDEPKGNVKFGMGQCYLFEDKEDSKYTYEYKIRFTNTETKAAKLIDFKCNDRNMSYKMENFQNSTVYKLEVIQIATPKNSGNVNLKENTKKETKNLTALSGGKGSKLEVENTKVIKSQKNAGVTEKELMKYYFRTSKFNTAQEKFGNNYKPAGTGSEIYSLKLNTIDSDGENISLDLNYKVPFPLLEGAENMDVYDAYGYYKAQQDVTVAPLINLKAEWISAWHKYVDAHVYDLKYKDHSYKTVTYKDVFAKDRYVNSFNAFGLTQKKYSIPPSEAMKIWNKNTEGPINLKSGQEFLKPRKALSQDEIAQAEKGIKIEDKQPKNAVLPLNYFVGIIVFVDAVKLYQQHLSWCWNDHLTWKYYYKCLDAQAFNKIGKWNDLLMISGDYYYKITYSYESDKPFNGTYKFNYQK